MRGAKSPCSPCVHVEVAEHKDEEHAIGVASAAEVVRQARDSRPELLATDRVEEHIRNADCIRRKPKRGGGAQRDALDATRCKHSMVNCDPLGQHW